MRAASLAIDAIDECHLFCLFASAKEVHSFETQETASSVLMEMFMERLDFDIRNIDTSAAAERDRERDSEDSRSGLTCASGSAAHRSFSIERLWDVLQPASAIF